MASLDEIVDRFDLWLNTENVPDYPGAINGLQLANRGKVDKIVAAVDASLPVIQEAITRKADLLVVHHGLFWQGIQPIVGHVYRKYKTAIDGGLAIYSSHIPLDIHADLGNSILLAKAIGLDQIEPFHEWKGVCLGVRGVTEMNLDQLIRQVVSSVGGDVNVCRGGVGDEVGEVGVVTGAAGSEIASIARSGIKTFITGEGPHWSYPLAEELGVNVIYAGHYATETFGVKALAQKAGREFGILFEFLNHPTGL